MSDGARCHYCRKVPCECAQEHKYQIGEFVRIISGKRAGIIAKIVSFDRFWIMLEVPDWGDPINYTSHTVMPVDNSKVVEEWVPYFGKQLFCGWKMQNEN